MRVLDLSTGLQLPDVLPDVDGTVVWGRDDAELFYLKFDEAHRPHQLWAHKLGTPATEDQLLFTEVRIPTRVSELWGLAPSAQ